MERWRGGINAAGHPGICDCRQHVPSDLSHLIQPRLSPLSGLHRWRHVEIFHNRRHSSSSIGFGEAEYVLTNIVQYHFLAHRCQPHQARLSEVTLNVVLTCITEASVCLQRPISGLGWYRDVKREFASLPDDA
jgi:hypothetical protein